MAQPKLTPMAFRRRFSHRHCPSFAKPVDQEVEIPAAEIVIAASPSQVKAKVA